MPPKIQLALVGIKIIFGIYAERFCWKFQADLLIAALIADALTLYFTRAPVFTLLAGLGAVFAAVNIALDWIRRRRNPDQEPFSHPDIGYRFFFRVGGLMFTRLGPLIVSPLGLLPLKVFRGIAEKYAKSVAAGEHGGAGGNEDNFLIRWNAPYALYEPED